MSSQLSLQIYLKKYSSISNSFIDDFFGLYSIKTTNNDFVINLDIVSKWLKSYKKNLKRTLVNTYIEKADYIIKLEEPGKGRPSETVLLTPDCFKRLCMLSRTEKAEEVRTYFLQLENHIDKYKDFIIEGLSQKVAKYETELKPEPVNTTKGAIYVIRTSEDIEGVYKIGRTKNFADRIKVHQSSHPDKLDIVHVYETDNIEKVEQCLKQQLKETAYRKRREFYEIDIDILKDLIKTCDCMNLSIRNKTRMTGIKECKYILHIRKHE